MVLSQVQEGKVRIEISSPVENVVAEHRSAAKDTTRPQLPSRLITCSQTMLGDQELFPLIVRLQDLEHDTRGIVFYLEEAKNYQPPDQPEPHRTGPGRDRPRQGTSSGSGARLKKPLASLRHQKYGSLEHQKSPVRGPETTPKPRDFFRSGLRSE